MRIGGLKKYIPGFAVTNVFGKYYFRESLSDMRFQKIKATILSVLLTGFLVTSCSDDNTRTCTRCSSPQTTEFEVCNEGDGNASVNGENTGVSFDVYIADLEAAGVTCGGS